MKKILIMLLLLLCATAYAEPTEFDPFPQNKGSVYQYGDDIPDVCFFPIDKARWNGYEVTAAKWSQLTDFQKCSFISEGVEEIERNEDVKVTIKDGWRLLVAINGGIAAVPKDTTFPVMRLLHDLLKMDGSIKPNNHGMIYKAIEDEAQDVRTNGYRWIEYSSEEKQLYIDFIYKKFNIDKNKYPVEKVIPTLDHLYDFAREDKKDIELDSLLVLPCTVVLSGFIDALKEEAEKYRKK